MADPFALKYDKYSLNQKEKLAKLCLKYKLEAGNAKEKYWDPKRKTFVVNLKSYKSKAVREFFPSLKNAKNDSLEFRKALQLANRCLKKYEESGAEQELEEKSKIKYREPGAGRKHTALEVRQAAFEWIIDVRGF